MGHIGDWNTVTVHVRAPRCATARPMQAQPLHVVARVVCLFWDGAGGVRRISGEGEVAVLAGRIVPTSEAMRMRRYSRDLARGLVVQGQPRR